jgi:hypothetical protein
MDGATIVLDEERLILRGRLAPAGQRPRRTSPGDRICAADGCRTRLSIYNPSALCWQHQVPRRFIQRADRGAATA